MPAKARPTLPSPVAPLRVIRPAPVPPPSPVKTGAASAAASVSTDVTVAARIETHNHSQSSPRRRTASCDLTDHQKRRMRKEHDAKDQKESKLKIIRNSQKTLRFYILCQHKINKKIASFRVFSTKEHVLNNKYARGMNLAGKFLAFWTAGISEAVSAAAVGIYSEYTFNKMDKAVLLTENTSNIDVIIESVAIELTLSYASALKQLTEEGIDVAAKFAAARILEKLLADNEDIELGIDPELLKIKFFNAVAHHPNKDKCSIFDTLTDHELITTNKEKWTIKNLFWRSLVVTHQGEVFEGKKRKDTKQGCCNQNEYPLRFARDGVEIAELRALDNSLAYELAANDTVTVRPRSNTTHMHTRSVFGFGDVAPLRAETKAEMKQNATVAVSKGKLNAAAAQLPAPNRAPLPSAPSRNSLSHKRSASTSSVADAEQNYLTSPPIPSAPPLPRVTGSVAPVLDRSRAASAAPTFSSHPTFKRFYYDPTATINGTQALTATAGAEEKHTAISSQPVVKSRAASSATAPMRRASVSSTAVASPPPPSPKAAAVKVDANGSSAVAIGIAMFSKRSAPDAVTNKLVANGNTSSHRPVIKGRAPTRCLVLG